MAKARLDWYGKQLLAAMEDVSDEILTLAAFQAEAEAKPNAPVDTGFMRNAIYGIGAGESNRDVAVAEALAVADRPLAPQPRLKKHEAALHGAAAYTIYQETELGFMYNGVQKAIAAIAQIIQQVGSKL